MRGRVRCCLPGAAMEVAELIGERNVIRLMAAYPPRKRNGRRGPERSGRYIYIPKVRGSGENGGRLERLIGRECLERLIKVYGGDRIYVSNCQEFLINYRIRCIMDLKELGLSAGDIAVFFGVTERYVFKLTEPGRRNRGERYIV